MTHPPKTRPSGTLAARATLTQPTPSAASVRPAFSGSAALAKALVVPTIGGAGWAGAAWAVAPWLPNAQVAPVAGGLGASGWLLAAMARHRSDQRRALIAVAATALGPLIGTAAALPARTAVRAKVWRGGWVGQPRRLELSYAPTARSSHPDWIASIIDTLAERLGATYELRRHDQRRCRLTLVQAQTSTMTASASAAQARAERVVRELLPGQLQVRCTWDGEVLVSMAVSHKGSTRLAQAGYRARVERVVSAMLPGRWRARWDLQADTVVFEVRPTFAESIWLPDVDLSGADILATYDQVALDYGVDEDGEVMWWRPAHDPNLMLCGAPGTGKTVCAHTLLARVTGAGWPVWVVDGKCIEFLGFRAWPNVQMVATTVAEQVAVIHRAHEVMEHRYALIVSGRAREEDFEPLMVFIDEWADFRGNVLEWWAMVKPKGRGAAKPPVLGKVASIARKGRTSRVHLIFGTQRPDAEYFMGDMRDNFRMRISMGRLSAQGAMMMWESPITGTTIPRGCRGRATTINDDDRPVEIQTYRTPDPRKVTPGSAQAELLDRLRPTVTRHERLLILDPEVQQDLDSGEPADPDYHDYANAEWVLASSRPDLDPLAGRAREGEDRTLLASPMTVVLRAGSMRSALQRAASALAPAVTLAPSQRPQVPAVSDDEQDQGVQDDAVWDVAYGEEEIVEVTQLQVGDLILVDDAVGLWAVLAEEPEPDVEDPEAVCLSYRTDDDEDGLLVLGTDDTVTIRRSSDDGDGTELGGSVGLDDVAGIATAERDDPGLSGPGQGRSRLQLVR